MKSSPHINHVKCEIVHFGQQLGTCRQYLARSALSRTSGFLRNAKNLEHARELSVSLIGVICVS